MAEYREKSEFNNAISFLARIDTMFYICDDNAVNLDINSWFHHLVALERELYHDMNDKEKEIIEKMRQEIAAKINQPVGRGQASTISQDLYDSMHQFELLLRKVYKDAGYQGKSKEDPRFALGGR